MKNYDVVSQVKQGEITTNLDNIIADLKVLMEPFETKAVFDFDDNGDIVYEEEDVKDAKKTRAKLNKITTLINDEKKRIKKEYMVPYTEVENKAKEAMELIKKGASNIGSQVEQIEEIERDQKKSLIKQYFNYLDIDDYVTFEQIFNPSWLNKTVSDKKWQEELEGKTAKIKRDLTHIDNLNVEFPEELKIEYLNNDFDVVVAEERYKEKQAMKEKVRTRTNAMEEKVRTRTNTIRYKVVFEEGTEELQSQLRDFLDDNNIEYRKE